MKGKKKKLFSSRKQLLSVILITAVTVIVTAAVYIILLGTSNIFRTELSTAYRSTVSRLSDEINGIGLNGIGRIWRESSVSSEPSGA